jgi:hypothetical protein
MQQLSSFTTEQLEYFATWKDNGLFTVQITDDNKTVVSKRKFKMEDAVGGCPNLVEIDAEVVAHIDNTDYQAEINNCLKRIELITNFVEQEGISAV